MSRTYLRKTKLRKMLLYIKYVTFCLERELGLIERPEMNEQPAVMEGYKERMLKWFEYSHLPPHLQETSKPFRELAQSIVDTVSPGPERTVALRKLLEAKDAAVRAKLNPGC